MFLEVLLPLAIKQYFYLEYFCQISAGIYCYCATYKSLKICLLIELCWNLPNKFLIWACVKGTPHLSLFLWRHDVQTLTKWAWIPFDVSVSRKKWSSYRDEKNQNEILLNVGFFFLHNDSTDMTSEPRQQSTEQHKAHKLLPVCLSTGMTLTERLRDSCSSLKF